MRAARLYQRKQTLLSPDCSVNPLALSGRLHFGTDEGAFNCHRVELCRKISDFNLTYWMATSEGEASQAKETCSI